MQVVATGLILSAESLHGNGSISPTKQQSMPASPRLEFEEDEKMLLRIGENFGLRGPEIDKLNLAALDREREKAVKDALDDLKKMTMTVIDGDFPCEVVGAQNLIFGEYPMPAGRDTSEFYDAKRTGGG